MLTLLTSIGCTTSNKLNPDSRKLSSVTEFTIKNLEYQTGVPLINSVTLRTGFFPEASPDNFKGCVLYLEGLADSMLNHRPYFEELSKNGYRVISFDYMGQGGSSGKMNHTRILDPVAPNLEIGNQAKFVWNHYSDCTKSKKMVIGWSTGGLAAYRLAYEEWADAVVLIAPGIHPNKLVGEAALNPSMLATGEQIITQRTLTRNTFEGQNDPHVDAINPVSPTRVPLFALNLIASSKLSHFWKIKNQIKGLVFLSGGSDTYVDFESTKNTLKYSAPHFSVNTYEGALHELDNELPEVTADLYSKTIEFLDSI